MKYLDSVINCGLFRELKKSQYIDAFEQLNIKCKSYKKGEPIIYEGDKIDKVCIVARGSVCGEKTDREGEVHILDVFEEGSIFGLEVTMSRTKKSVADYISNEESDIVYVSLNEITRSDYFEKIQKAITYMLADNAIRTARKVEILRERGLRNRILVYLNILSKKAKSDTITVRMNREQMAQYLCVNRSALSNELNKMKKEGLIDFKRDKFTIL